MSTSSQQNDGGDAGESQDGQQQAGQQSGQGNQGQGKESGTDKGYPENTPIAEMNHEQRAAYYKHQNRKAESTLSAYKGVTPEQIAALQQENETLKNEKLTADQKALKDATTQAAVDARSAADAEWRPKYLAARLEGLAAGVIKDQDQLKSFLALTDAAKFAGEDGELDHEKVMGHLTALFGGSQQQGGQRGQQWSWGQHSGGNGSPNKPGEAGAAAAAKRHGIKTS